MADLPPIPGHCPKCGHYNELTARFCAQCGVAIPSAKKQPADPDATEDDSMDFTHETTGTVPVASTSKDEPSVGLKTALGELADAENDVRRNQQLVGLKKIPQWEESLSDLRPKSRDVAVLEGLYRKWNFRSKLEELGGFPF